MTQQAIGYSDEHIVGRCHERCVTPNHDIDRTPEQRRFACCSGAGHAGR
jgi:hypothetical protein